MYLSVHQYDLGADLMQCYTDVKVDVDAVLVINP